MSEKYEVIRIEIAKLELHPGDTLVIKIPEDMREADLIDIFESMKYCLPPGFNNKILYIRG